MLQQFVESAGGETVDLSKPSKAGLIHLLRNPQLWPPGFGEWNFLDCHHCAMGLAHAAWPKEISHPCGPTVRRAIGIGNVGPFYHGWTEGESIGISPEDIARRLELAA